VLKEYIRVVQDTVQSHSPLFSKIKTESDGFMARFPNAHVMVECGIHLKREFVARGWRIRLGGHYVEAFEEPDRDLIGADMNRAARIASAADAATCQFLVSDAVSAVVRDRISSLVFKEHGYVDAKGVPGGLMTYTEGDTVLTRRWTWRQATHTLTLPETAAIKFNVDGLPPVPPADVEQACGEIAELVTQFCGGRIRCELVSQAHPRISLAA
jgi:class 3 adenylate cyclase